MNIFPFLHFFNAIVYLYLAVYIFFKNPKALVNRLCFAFLICFVVWSFPMTFIHNPYVSKNIARLAADINALGWCSFSSFYLWFILAFTGKKKILKKKWFYLFLLGLPILFIYKQWTNCLFTDFTMQYYGWRPLWSQNVWPYLFYTYYLSFMVVGLYINIVFMKKTQNPILKKQAAIIFFILAIVLILGTVTDVIFPLTNVHIIPNIADTLMLSWAFGVVYAIARYKFLTITPATAADNIISTMYDCLILLNTEGKIVNINKSTSGLLGYKEDELKGIPVSKLLTAEKTKDDLFEKITREGNLKNKDLTFKTKEGKEIPMLFSGSILKDETGNTAGMVCVAKDISQRKKMEEEILRSRKLESIGILAGGIAHDFNNLLYAILGNIELALEEVSPGAKGDESLKQLKAATLQAAELARKFITFSQGGWLNRGKVILPRIIHHVMESEPGLKDKNIIFDITIPRDLAPIDGDEFQLRQMLQNLVRNAVEAIPPGQGGRIFISAENMTVEEANEVENENKFFLKAGQYVKVFIEDNGLGIPADNIEKIFDPYFSTREKGAQKGMGLGLTLCYSIIKKHGGHIRVESEQGKGTTVIVYIPAYTGEH